MKIPSLPRRLLQLATCAAAAAALSGCYVVPMYPSTTAAGAVQPGAPAAAPAPVTFTARLYPANDLAGAYGVVPATVSNDLNGRGHFLATLQGESFSGEATRVAGSRRDGIASGTGSRGSFLICRYSMNTPVLGTGSCKLSNGALFTMHIGG